ncbi:MAG: MoaD/ThiS family protein [Chloroflexota bacterium]
MPVIKIPTPLRPYAGGQNEITVQGSIVIEVLRDLVTQYPALEKHLFSTEDKLRPYVNLFLGEEDVRYLQGEATILKEDDKLRIIPSIAGGCDRDAFTPGVVVRCDIGLATNLSHSDNPQSTNR